MKDCEYCFGTGANPNGPGGCPVCAQVTKIKESLKPTVKAMEDLNEKLQGSVAAKLAHQVIDLENKLQAKDIVLVEVQAKLNIAMGAMEKFKTTFLDKYHPGENWFPETLIIGEALEKLK